MWLLVLLFLNIGTTFYLRYRIHNRNRLILLLGYLWVFPVIGLILSVAIAVSSMNDHLWNYDRESLVARDQLNNAEVIPRSQEELNVVPIADAMAASTSYAKRNLILDQMKKDLYRNYQELIPASADSDSETAHYVSALRMEVYTLLQKEVTDSYEQWQDSQTGEELAGVLDKLADLINSGLLSSYEMERQSHRFCSLVDKYRENKVLPEKLVSSWMKTLQTIGCAERILDLWQQQSEEIYCESGLLSILRASIQEKDADCFMEVLDYVKEHPENIRSWNIQEQISYWDSWRKRNAFS